MQTGYPSIDKPWLKYYKQEDINRPIPEKTCYEMLVSSSKKYEKNTAIDYYGKKISYGALLHKVDMIAAAFYTLGVRKGDIITFLAVSTPEIIFSFYALNKIGAIPNMIDPRSNANAIMHYIEEVDSKFLVTLDLCCSNVEKVIDSTKVKKAIVISAYDSMPALLRCIFKITKKLKNKNNISSNDKFITWQKFVDDTDKGLQIVSLPYAKDSVAAMVHTGGTTGIPKGVLLSNYNFNAVMHQVKYCPINLASGDKFLNVLVPFVAYGLALGIHVPMTLGWQSILIPKFEPKDIVKLMKKHDPQAVMGIETYFEPLLSSDYDFGHVKAMLMGGMPTKESFEKNINDVIASNRGNFKVCKGYSMTEASSTATCSFDNANEIGSNGIPLINTIVAAFDSNTGKELGYNERGEICISSPTVMLGYYKNEEATKQVLQKHKDGRLWIHSGDIGYVTEDGFVYIVDRIKRMIIRRGYKVFPSEIENVFLKHPSVENCAVIGINDKEDDKVPQAHIILKSTNSKAEETIKMELDEYIEKYGLPVYFKPVSFKFRQSLPLTSIGKVDFRALEAEAENLGGATNERMYLDS